MDAIRHFLETMHPHWNTVALILTWLGIGIVYLRRRAHWRRKQFLGRVNFSLNHVAGNALVMRTLLEADTMDVWLNEYGVRTILAALRRTTVDQPFILMDNAVDRQFVNRAVLNALSERFSETFLSAALGEPVRTATFCFAVTFERYQEMRTFKVRVLLIAEQTLLELFGPGGRSAQLEIKNEVYLNRLKTLQGLFDLYVRDQTADSPVVGRVELGIPVARTTQRVDGPHDRLPAVGTSASKTVC
jgi:hypothetical protein